MSLGLVGRKCGMTRVFLESGEAVPVTVVAVSPNRITQVKTPELDGYASYQVTIGTKKPSRINKAEAGHFTRAKVEAGDLLKEFRISEGDLEKVKLGGALTVELFKEGQMIDVRGLTKGKGFAGVIKRHHFNAQDATHGNSRSHRAPGSIGQRQTPGRVFKGKKMAGHLGDDFRTIQNLKIVKIDAERQLILINGAIPGAPGGTIVITSAKKYQAKEKG